MLKKNFYVLFTQIYDDVCHIPIIFYYNGKRVRFYSVITLRHFDNSRNSREFHF